MATVILDANDSYTAASAVTIRGSSGSETVKIYDGVAVNLDSNVERVEFARASSAYQYKATANGVEVSYNGTVVTTLFSGDKAAFTDGSAVVAGTIVGSTLSFTLGGTAVPSTAGAVVPTLVTTAGEASTITSGSGSSTGGSNGTYTLASDMDTVVEGETATFTVTRSGDVTAAKTLTFNASGDTNNTTVAAAAAGVDASPASGTVTFAAGATTATFTVSASADTAAEGLEGLRVRLFDGTTAVADKVVLINDDTTGTSVPGNTFTLTTGADSVGGSTNTYSGFDNGAATATFNSGDVISSAKALNLTFTSAANAVADVNNVEAVNVNLVDGNANLNAALFDNVGKIAVKDVNVAGVLTVATGALATTYAVENATSVNSGITVGIRAGDVAGTADTLKLSVNNAGSVVVPSVGAAPVVNTATLTGGAGVEKVTLATAGTNNVAIVDTITAGVTTEYKTLEVTGNGTNTINASALGQATLFDMSTSTGTNTLNMVGALATGTTVKGGTGTDTLRVAQATTAANLTVEGVETLRMSSGGNTGNTGTLAFATAPSFTTLRVDGDAAEAGINTLTNLGNTVATINFVGDSLTANAAGGQQFNNVVINNSYTGTADSVAINIGNGGVANGGGYALTTGLTINGAETLNVKVADHAAALTTALNLITDNALSSLSVESVGAVTLGVDARTAAGASGSVALIDLSKVTGSGVSTITVANGNGSIGVATVIKGATGTGGTTLNLQDAEAATDSVIYTGGQDVDTISAVVFSGTIVADTGAGADVIVSGTGNDALTGGEGADTILGGSGNDSIVLTETTSAADRVVIDAVATNGSDTITGFTVGTDVIAFTADGTSAATWNNNSAGAGAAGANVFTLATTAVNAVNEIIVLNAATYATAALADAAADAYAAAAITAGDNAYWIYTDGTNAYVYADADVTATSNGDLTLLATLTGVTTTAQLSTLAAANFLFV